MVFVEICKNNFILKTNKILINNNKIVKLLLCVVNILKKIILKIELDKILYLIIIFLDH